MTRGRVARSIAAIFLAGVVGALVAMPKVRAELQSPNAHPKILLLGDSVLDQHGHAAAVLLRQHGFRVETHGAWGTGLLTREQYDFGATVAPPAPGTSKTFNWLSEGKADINRYRPDDVVVYLDHNYWPPHPRDAHGHDIDDLRSPAGQAMIATQTRAFINILRSHGAHVAFEAPIPSNAADAAAANPIWAGYLPVLHAMHVEIIDVHGAIADGNGVRVETMVDCTGAPTRVRPAGDLHLTRYGAGRIGTALAEAIAHRYGRTLHDVAPGDHTTTVVPTASGHGYWMVGCDGGVYNFGDAPAITGAELSPGTRVVGAAAAAGRGLWLVTNTGRILPLGTAPALRFASGPPLPLVTAAGTPDHRGIVAADATGHIATAGTARFEGNAEKLGAPVVSIAVHPAGDGYWLVTADGTVLAFGRAHTHGTPDAGAFDPVVGITASASGNGYWTVRVDGHVEGFGDARAAGDAPHPDVTAGSVASVAPSAPSIAVVRAPATHGYWVVDDNGAVHGFGGAPPLGGVNNLALFTL